MISLGTWSLLHNVDSQEVNIFKILTALNLSFNVSDRAGWLVVQSFEILTLFVISIVIICHGCDNHLWIRFESGYQGAQWLVDHLQSMNHLL